MTEEVKNINKQLAKGSAWMVMFKLVEKSISIVSTIILARLLVPEDFGLVTMAMMVVTLLELMRAFGFDMALIHNQNATREHYDTAWTFNIIAALLISIMLLLLTPLAASFYKEIRLLEIIPLLAIGVFISGFENIGVVAFRKELTFHKEFAYLLSKKVISFVVGVSLAVYYRNYWALIGAFIITNIGVTILSFLLHHYRPKFCLKQSKELFAFSSWLFLNNILAFIFTTVPEAIIGKVTNAGALGLFNVSKDITYSTSTAIVLPINRAAFPSYSKLNTNLPELKNSILNTIGMIAMITIPSSVGFSVITPVMVPVLLGENWLDAIIIMQILAFCGLFFALANNNAAYMALGKPNIITKIMLVRIIVLIPSLIFALNKFGIVGATWSLFITGLITLPFAYWPLQKILNIRVLELLSPIIRPATASLTMYLVVDYTYTVFIKNQVLDYGILQLFAIVMLGAITFLSTLLISWKLVGFPSGSEQQILDSLRDKLRKQ